MFVTTNVRVFDTLSLENDHDSMNGSLFSFNYM